MFKTLSEQIAILQSRGVIIDDNASSRRLLLDNNYYSKHKRFPVHIKKKISHLNARKSNFIK